MTRSSILLRTLPALFAGAMLSACVSTTPDTAPDITATAPRVGAATLERLLTRAEQAREAGALKDAEAHYRFVLRQSPRHAEARLGLAEVKLAEGAPEQALDLFLRLTDEPEVAARANQGVGLTSLALRDLRAAEPALARAVEGDPKLWRAWNALAVIHDSRRAWAQAGDAYAQAIAAAPEGSPAQAMLHNNLGYSLMLQGRFAEAEPHLLKALALDASLDRARANLRLTVAWQGRYREALSGTTPAHLAEALNNVGFVALTRADYEDAEAYLSRAIENSPGHFEAATRNLDHLRALRNGA